MLALKCLVIASFIFVESLSMGPREKNETAEFLWTVANIALESRRYGNYPYPYKYSGKYPEYYQNYPSNSYTRYPGSKLHTNQPSYFTQKYQHPYDHFPNPYRPLNQKLQESFMEVLLSVAKNDNLQCVPKIICEITSGTLSGRQTQNLPVNINLESLIGLLSTVNGLQISPLFYYGNALLQGYTSKGNTGSCGHAYPQCPSDPEELVHYLNNHNGGFFRFFNGVPSQKSQHGPTKAFAEQRIQNIPNNYVDDNFRDQKEFKFPFRNSIPVYQESKFKFPLDDTDDNNIGPNIGTYSSYDSHNTLRFPDDNLQPFRKPKELHYYDGLDIQKPLPNHQASPIIFPVRTGTGELRLDPQELDAKPFSYVDDEVRITFNGFRGGEHFGNNDINTFNSVKHERGFSFPSR